jgi:uncharacterized protein YvpB
LKFSNFWGNKFLRFTLGLSLAVLVLFFGYKASFLPAKLTYELRLLSSKILQNPRIAGGSIFQLPAVYYRQEHSLSCEIAALKMALSVYGLNVAESELIAQLPFDHTVKKDGKWGDPNVGFVGNIDGKMPVTGYGVYWDPIAQTASHYSNAEVMQFDAKKLASEIKAGHPVIAWGFVGMGKKLFWTAPSGKQIIAINGEHARTVVGFSGSVESPTGFVILDPIYGKLYWKTSSFMDNWSAFNYMGVVVKGIL